MKNSTHPALVRLNAPRPTLKREARGISEFLTCQFPNHAIELAQLRHSDVTVTAPRTPPAFDAFKLNSERARPDKR
jgi:hypothetical protein